MSDLVVLVGYMGSGKTSVGKALAIKFKRSHVDLDALIEANEQKTISEIFKIKGAIYFRKREKELLEEVLSSHSGAIISVGGGTPCYYENMDLINRSSTSIYLQSNVKALSDRLYTQKDSRPLLKNVNSLGDLQEFVGKHLFERSAFYSKAHHSINVSDLTVEEVMDECQALLNYTD